MKKYIFLAITLSLFFTIPQSKAGNDKHKKNHGHYSLKIVNTASVKKLLKRDSFNNTMESKNNPQAVMHNQGTLTQNNIYEFFKRLQCNNIQKAITLQPIDPQNIWNTNYYHDTINILSYIISTHPIQDPSQEKYLLCENCKNRAQVHMLEKLFVANTTNESIDQKRQKYAILKAMRLNTYHTYGDYYLQNFEKLLPSLPDVQLSTPGTNVVSSYEYLKKLLFLNSVEKYTEIINIGLFLTQEITGEQSLKNTESFINQHIPYVMRLVLLFNYTQDYYTSNNTKGDYYTHAVLQKIIQNTRHFPNEALHNAAMGYLKMIKVLIEIEMEDYFGGFLRVREICQTVEYLIRILHGRKAARNITLLYNEIYTPSAPTLECIDSYEKKFYFVKRLSPQLNS